MARQAGFTLIEIVFVIAVLGVLATLGVQALSDDDRITRLATAEDQVIAELRRARSQTLNRLPPKTGNQIEVAALDAEVGPSVSVCPERIRYRFGGDYTGSVEGADCAACSPCDDQSPYEITLSAGDRNKAICLVGETGRVERSPCE
jgi:prepilin-type N-terminal cleavage/methylation domain-containing protein